MIFNGNLYNFIIIYPFSSNCAILLIKDLYMGGNSWGKVLAILEHFEVRRYLDRHVVFFISPSQKGSIKNFDIKH